MSVNKVILVGNVGKDPETRYLDENTPVCKFPFATSEVYKNREGEKITQTEWHNIVLWRGLAQVAEKYVHKGSQLYIEGRIRTRSYDDKDGVKKYITEIVGDTMQMLGRKGDDSGSGQQDQYQSQQGAQSQSQSQGQSAGNNTGGNSGNAAGNQGYDEQEDFGAGQNDADDLPF